MNNEIPGVALPKRGRLIFLGFRGSVSHGTFVPSSDPHSIDDKDVIGCYTGGLEHYFGFGESETWEKFHGQWDVVAYELRKFFVLLLKNNPNVLGTLWLPEKMVIKTSPAWEAVIRHRDIFVSKLAYKSFAGYASGQLHRMTHMQFQGYMGPKRRRIVEKFGYDVKNAGHLIRLLRMGIEFLRDGTMYVDRTNIDAEELIDIKLGRWSLERVKSVAETLFSKAREAVEKSLLPEKPDRAAAEKLLMSLLRDGVI